MIGEKRLKTKKDVMKFLKECGCVHKLYSNNPRICRGNIGSAEFHQKVYYQYQDAINILKRI